MQQNQAPAGRGKNSDVQRRPDTRLRQTDNALTVLDAERSPIKAGDVYAFTYVQP